MHGLSLHALRQTSACVRRSVQSWTQLAGSRGAAAARDRAETPVQATYCGSPIVGLAVAREARYDCTVATFKDIAGGTHARRGVDLALATEQGEQLVDLDVRTLTGAEELHVLRSAADFAKANGAEAIEDGEARYELGRQLFTVLVGCVERESPKDAPRPFFDSVEQILASKRLTRDHVAYLHSHVEQWQDECSPRKMTLSPAQFAEVATRSAEGDFRPFLRLRPGMQLSFLHILAKLRGISPEDRSPSGSASAISAGS